MNLLIIKRFRPRLSSDWTSPLFSFRVLSLASKDKTISAVQFPIGITCSKFLLRSSACILLHNLGIGINGHVDQDRVEDSEEFTDYDSKVSLIILAISTVVPLDGTSVTLMQLLSSFSGLVTNIIEGEALVVQMEN